MSYVVEDHDFGIAGTARGEEVVGLKPYHFFAWDFLGLQNKYDSVQMHEKWRKSEP